ncbi:MULTISPECIES: agmatine/peptidylarginine deiminase [unclassified Rhodococcus (in: high G+C Gram-positive bacteria)]|uniref:agmatine deiminase family protein n=1 Tax=unclassified Rhodococcus (in: high G+C Gram-positive bacteria) TaxID=192944 RepID=UPI0006F598D1|nr:MULTISPECIES: agmatine deiminase family protein [unclassified Rhodococcus (in: high G+C Gram-positive bacteria)]KQU32092.1 agmatine deiminase [Rhodococcus sp. Leaf225]KQU41259.1 agmatine deiminase [Rhodococcus sp. Leaf258]
MTWRMPAEGEPHERTWMAFPSPGYSLGDTEEERHEARTTWAAVARAVAEFEPVTVLVDPREARVAAEYLGSGITILEAPLDDAWMRDIGPTFVVSDDGTVGAVDWVFNGWGAQEWATWENDARIGALVARAAGVPVVATDMVNEGGGIQVDGAGTVLLTDTVQLDSGRNPTWSKQDVEAELSRILGVDRAIWLPRGLTRDSETYGTRGHVDIVAAMPTPGVALVHDQRDPTHPDHEISRDVMDLLTREGLRVVPVPAPTVLRDDEGVVDYSYINHYVVNGGVIACRFDDPNDDEAVRILSEAYPGRRVVSVDARPLFTRGGGIHCITQHQPAPVVPLP